jgi:paraquat-inducible protein A
MSAALSLSRLLRPLARPLADASSPALTPSHWVECSDCGLLQVVPALARDELALCPRCDAVLRRAKGNPLDVPFALSLAGAALFVIGCFTTLMTVSTAGIYRSAGLFSGPYGLEQHGLWELGVIVLVTTFLAPAVHLACMIYVLGGLRLQQPSRWLRYVFGWIARLRPWAMIEVYLLGLFVAYVKLGDLVHIETGVGLYAFAALMLTMIAVDVNLDFQRVWEAMERRGIVEVPPHRPAWADDDVIGCDTCMKVSRKTDGLARCPRCGSSLRRRKPNALRRTWALVIASIILYVPANVYPVLTVVRLGAGGPSTILGGVEELASAGQWPLAILVFVASIMVPVLKLVGLVGLLISTQTRRRGSLPDRTLLYRILALVGRWSMIDIFMASILVALVQFGAISTVNPGVGGLAFAAVVILTMLAAETFDPRLMWDAAGQNPQ